MWVTILGKRYRFTFTRRLARRTAGECDHPEAPPPRRIRVSPDLDEEEKLTIIIHEILHAADWSKEEWWVEQAATDIARILWRLGYRRPGVEGDST